MFASRGVPVLDADRIAREVVEPGQAALRELVALLGVDILTPDGALDRPRVRDRVFKDAALRRRVESIIHPRVRELMETRARQVTAPYCILTIPLLLEADQQTLVDQVLVVDVPRELQIKRTCARDHSPPEAVARIVDAQLSREARLAAADHVIHNDGDLDNLDRQVERLHRLFTRSASGHLPGADE